MKKIITIFLLSLMLFNMVGYRFVFSILGNIASVEQETRIDEGDYDESSLVEIKVPLNMPYQQRVTEFERHYGEITVEGVVYTYVKMKINDSVLILQCLPDLTRLQLKNAENIIAKANSNQDTDNTGKKHNASFSKNLVGDYDNTNQLYDLSKNSLLLKLNYTDFTSPVLKTFKVPPYQPPRC